MGAVAQDARTICETERLPRRLTMGANEPLAPASLLQVGHRTDLPQSFTQEPGGTLHVGGVGKNRIGKEESMVQIGRIARTEPASSDSDSGAAAARYRHGFGGLSVRFLVGQSVRNPADSAEFSAHGRPALAHLFLSWPPR